MRRPGSRGRYRGGRGVAFEWQRGQHFRLDFASPLTYARAVAKALPPITVNGVRYRVLKFEAGARGPRYLLRNESGRLFGVYGRNAQTALSAAPLELKLTADNPFRGLDFFETAEGRLLVRG